MAVVSGPTNAAVRRTRAMVPQASIYLCENTQADPERYDDWNSSSCAYGG